MKVWVTVCFFLVAIRAFAQDEDGNKLIAFGEVGAGYSYNLLRPYSVSTGDIFSPDFFTNGITSEVHFGIMLNSKLKIGLASHLRTSIYFMNEKKAQEKLSSVFPGLSITWQTNGVYLLTGIQVGPVISLPVKNWALDAELFFGHSSIHMPHLFSVASKKPYPNSEELYMYIYRPAQSFKYTTVTPSLGVRRDYKKIYGFFRSDISFGWGEGVLKYEYYPGSATHNYSAFEHQLLNLTVGIGYKIQ